MINKSFISRNFAEIVAREHLSESERSRLYRLMSYVLKKYIREGISFDEPIEISVKHFRSQIGTHYLKDLKKLIELGILNTDGKYYFKIPYSRRKSGDELGKCKSYYFSKSVYSNPALISFNEKAKKRFSRDFIIKESVKLLSKIKLNIRENEIKSKVSELVSYEYVRERCKIKNEILNDYYVSKRSISLSRDRWLELAKRNKKEFMLYDNKAILVNSANEFIYKKMYELRLRYTNELLKLKNIRKRVNITCSRNDTNKRLDTNLTTLKSELLKYVKLDNENLYSIDLRNSQFLILAKLISSSAKYIEYLQNKASKQDQTYSKNFTYLLLTRNRKYVNVKNESVDIKNIVINIIKSTISHINVTHFFEDKKLKPFCSKGFNSFLNLTKSGFFYEKMLKTFNDKNLNNVKKSKKKKRTRDEIKKMMFMVVFSSSSYNSSEKRDFALAFPHVAKWIKEFKRACVRDFEKSGMSAADARKKGNAALAVMLQSIESYIFIDVILKKLIESELRVFSKHDSILCKKSDVSRVLNIIKSELDEIFGIDEYKLKVSEAHL